MNGYSWNSTLRPMSKKRQAELAAGIRKPKPRKPLAKMSTKQRAKIKNYREIAFETWGERCFLCGRTPEYTHLDVHHKDGNRNNNTPENLIPLCNRYYGCRAHNHLGSEGLETLRIKIENKGNMK